MPLITETGAGLADAESYCDAAFADQYHADRANTAWAALDATQKDAYLRRATEYMLAAYREKWKGARATSTQALDWPRIEVVVDGFELADVTVPVEVQKACAILALRAISSALDADPAAAVKRKKVDVLEVEYFEQGSKPAQHKAVDDLLRPFLAGLDMNVRLVRA